MKKCGAMEIASSLKRRDKAILRTGGRRRWWREGARRGGNTESTAASRTLSRLDASIARLRVREAAGFYAKHPK